MKWKERVVHKKNVYNEWVKNENITEKSFFDNSNSPINIHKLAVNNYYNRQLIACSDRQKLKIEWKKYIEKVQISKQKKLLKNRVKQEEKENVTR